MKKFCIVLFSLNIFGAVYFLSIGSVACGSFNAAAAGALLLKFFDMLNKENQDR